MTQKAIFVFVAVCVIVVVNHGAIVNGDVLATIAMVVVIA